MTALTRQPQTEDMLSPFGYQFSILKAPNVNFFIQSIEHPGITLNVANVPTPFEMLRFPGGKLEYGDITITFKVDEKMQTYFELHDWMRKLGHPVSFDEYAQLSNDSTKVDTVVSDMSLIVLSNQKNPIVTFSYKDAFPISLGPLVFDTTQTDLQYLTVTAIFAYRSFEVVSPA